MKQELFNQYLLDVSRWLKKSRELMISARYLVSIEEGLFLSGKDLRRADSADFDCHPFQAFASVGTAALLLGLALENLIKGHLVSIGEITIDEENKIRGLSGNHDLPSMLAQTGCDLSKEENQSISRLTFQLQTLSKYHLAKSTTKQAEFTGQVENSRVIYDLVIRIAKKLLSDRQFEMWMMRDTSYDHIPEVPFFMEE
jgi:hypothetical protein